ncbi:MULTISPECIES: right-handed parallel beta-helix repeat-containing protein [Methylobacterium]|uniref:right-handed parallel beta-helix repeat-containing protein n=1 Tax=Methylobacterium TaxID=407 RepID=UPI0013EE01F5|nr:right-handed parallel beta-helix repeat-containing protein [Methylobacterium sp. DB0501]NGM34254.1 right-handed parallel beta-helix repeat-containing protein [Methylobacterium sp. DB0501]
MPVALAFPPEPPALVRRAAATPCDAAVRARLLAPPRPGEEEVSLTCSLRLAPGDRILKRLVLEGSAASNLTLDCAGAGLGVPGEPAHLGAYTIAIRSRPPARPGEAWDRPSGIRIRDCTVFGHVRIWGMGENGQGPLVRESSHSLGHTARAQAAAPTDVTITGTTITAAGPIPLYLGPGVTRVTLRGSRLAGRSVSTALYLDAESAENRIEDNAIETETGRELVAVDGSARNRITGNRFILRGEGGVRLYRNCGEGGTVRHQTPSDNVVTGNVFRTGGFFQAAPIVVNSRNGWRLTCGEDAGYPFGSSLDNRDNGTGNVVAPNTVE